MIERAVHRGERRGGHMDVPRGGAEAAMTEQDLDGPQVGAGLEQMGGEAVPQGMDDDPFLQPGDLSGLVARLAYAAGGDRPVGGGPGEEDVAGPSGLPVGAEDLQQPRGEHDVAILLPLALADMD